MARNKPEEIKKIRSIKNKDPMNHAEFRLFPTGNEKSLKDFKIFRTVTIKYGVTS